MMEQSATHLRTIPGESERGHDYRTPPGESPRQQCPICQGFLPDERNGGEFVCPKCGTEFSL